MKLSDIRLFRKKEQTENTDAAIENASAAEESGTGRDEGPARYEGRLNVLPEDSLVRPPLFTILRVALAIVVVLASVFLKDLPPAAVLTARIVAALGAGFDIIWNTVRDFRARVFSCDGPPVILAAILAFSAGRSLEAAAAVIILEIALCFRKTAYCRTKETLCGYIRLPDGSGELAAGDSIMLEGGMVSPADCRVAQGSLTADLSFIYGDRAERPVKVLEAIPAGCLVISGSALVEVIRPASESDAANIARAIENGYETVTRTERRINKFADYLMPLALVVSAILIIMLSFMTKLAFIDILGRVAVILAVSSPCGVLLSIPLVYLASMSKQRGSGTVFLTSAALDNTAYTKTVVFDKAGTLTSGRFQVSEISSEKMDAATFLKVAAHAVSGSSNPMADAIAQAYSAPVSSGIIRDFAEFPGWGVSVTVDNISILLGTGSFMDKNQIQVSKLRAEGCVLHMAVGGIPAGRIILKSAAGRSSAEAIKKLENEGIDRVVMVSGDGRESDGVIAREMGVKEYFSECSDADKARHIKELRNRIDAKTTVSYICAAGGSREAARSADVAVVVNSSDVNTLGGEADALFLDSGLERLPEVFLAGRAARRLVYGFVLAGLAVKLLIAILAGAGIVPLWFGVLLDCCASLALIVGTTVIISAKS